MAIYWIGVIPKQSGEKLRVAESERLSEKLSVRKGRAGETVKYPYPGVEVASWNKKNLEKCSLG